MTAALQEFTKNDSGFEQYADRYEEVSGDLAVRRQFAAWTAEMDKLDIVRMLSLNEGLVKGKAEGLAEGKAIGEREKTMKDARNLLSLGVEPEIIAKAVELSLEEVLELVQR